LEPTVEGLLFQINKLSPFIKYFQIDIADGIFVPNKTLSLDSLIPVFKKQSNNETMKQCAFDFHLMVSDFERDIAKLNQLNKYIVIKNIFIHYSAIKNFKLKIEKLSDIPIGLTLNPEDSVDNLKSHFNLKKLPTIQIMSVTPGVQGNPFIPNTLNKIEQLRLLDYRNKIYLDGAVNDKTLPFINEQKYKPDVICPGSYLTKTKTLKKNVEYLNQFV
jgi:ribulose-phosphate 3-epimerase